MQYMLLIYEDEGAEVSDEEQRASIDAHIALAARLRAERRFIAGDPLQPSSTVTTVRLDRSSGAEPGKVVVTDGPYADTKEQLGGFYIVEAADLDQALEDAVAIPSIGWGVIEVRPLLDLSGN
ncbi:MAG: YciI family protein [Actinobacteria bacterium]|nr:YciI family protein [Actinomycetota bacterium]